MTPSLLAELKRRQVFRTATVYGAGAFVVVQAADLIFPRIGLPDRAVTWIVIAALVGLPIALLLSWFFDVKPATPQPTEAGPTTGVAVALVMVIVLGLSGWYAARHRSHSYDSIAVLAFTDLSGQPGTEYFADGLADELINALASVKGLRVPARTSSFAFKGKNVDVRTIGDTLNVDAVLEGTVRRGPDRARINVELIDAHNGYQMWSKSYDRPLTELSAVQQSMAAAIVDELEVQLAGKQKNALYRGGTRDVQAYDLYLKGREIWRERNMTLMPTAIADFEAAIARDSSFALAWSGLADAIDALAYRNAAARARLDEAEHAAQRAILLDPELAEGWASLGVLMTDFGHDWRVALLALERAVALKPAYAQAQRWLSDAYRYAGYSAAAVAPSERSVELDPVSGLILNSHAQVLSSIGRYAEARQLFLRAAKLTTASPATLGSIMYARELGFSENEVVQRVVAFARYNGIPRPENAAVVGRAVFRPELRPEAARFLSSPASAGAQARDLANLAVAIKEYDLAIRMFETSVERGEGVFAYGADPIYDPLRRDPRFQRILQTLHMRNCDPACRSTDAKSSGRGL